MEKKTKRREKTYFTQTKSLFYFLERISKFELRDLFYNIGDGGFLSDEREQRRKKRKTDKAT